MRQQCNSFFIYKPLQYRLLCNLRSLLVYCCNLYENFKHILLEAKVMRFYLVKHSKLVYTISKSHNTAEIMNDVVINDVDVIR